MRFITSAIILTITQSFDAVSLTLLLCLIQGRLQRKCYYNIFWVLFNKSKRNATFNFRININLNCLHNILEFEMRHLFSPASNTVIDEQQNNNVLELNLSKLYCGSKQGAFEQLFQLCLSENWQQCEIFCGRYSVGKPLYPHPF